MKRFIILMLFTTILIGSGMISEILNVHAAVPDGENQESLSDTDPEQTPGVEADAREENLLRSYLFIHDTSLNMRRRRRIQIMQTSIRKILENIPSTASVGLRAFGHRFPSEGPDACIDTEIVVPVDRLSITREDFETQLNILAYPPIGGGAPVGLALKQGIADIEDLQGPKEVYLYLVDLLKCEDNNPLDIIQSACQVDDLHLTLIGFGLRSDMQTLLQNNIQKLGCVDIVNLTTADEAETLPEKLLTRLSVEFRNAEGQLVDPNPGNTLILQVFQKNQEEELDRIRQKVKDSSVKGVSIDTVGLDEGTYFLDVVYNGQKLRARHEVSVIPKQKTSEVIQLGRMSVEVTDSEGNPIEDPMARQLKITVTEAGKVVRTIAEVSRAEFDLLPSKYKVLVSYMVGEKLHETAFQETVEIEEGNHKRVSVQLSVGSVSGLIVDMLGRPAEDVEMQLVSIEGAEKMQRRVRSDAHGEYMIPDIPVGVYELSFEKSGYKRETKQISVVGGKINEIEAIELFHGIEVFVLGVSGTTIADADVEIVNKATSEQIPVMGIDNTYRNTDFIPEGEYTVSVHKTGYKSASQEISIRDTDASLDMSFHLPYYITVKGTTFNGKGQPLPDTVIEFQHQHSIIDMPDIQQQILTTSEGIFEARLLVTGEGDEVIRMLWKDLYNQDYIKEVTFSLPPVPEPVELGTVILPINFVRLAIHDILGHGVVVDRITMAHRQTGQSGMQVTPVEEKLYESAALLDGDYTVRIIKEGFQEVEQQITVSGGEMIELPITLYNYVTVSGTVTDGKNNRVPGASVKLQELNSELTSRQPIVTGKDGRFRTTLLVKKPEKEKIEVLWKSPESGNNYRIEMEFDLPGTPFEEFQPMNLGEYQLPVNFVNIEVQDTSKRGLSGVQVTFISEGGEVTPGVELGGGIYESVDLQDGRYDIAIKKEGYKENFLIPDVAVGTGFKEVAVGPVVLPHYATVAGIVLNGKDEGMPHVEISFGDKQSEQLEKCRTDQYGKFTTTLLVTGTGEESWQAVWKSEKYSTSGSFPLPVHPKESVNMGEIRMPVNFVSLPVEDVQGNALSGVTVNIANKDGTPLELEEFILEEIEPGQYQAKNLPDGEYMLSLRKEDYEIDKTIDVTVEGGKHYRLDPMKLGYYVRVEGTAVNGKQEPVVGAVLTFSERYSTVLPSESDEEEIVDQTRTPSVPSPAPSVVTAEDGTFTAKLLVNVPGIEQVSVSWKERELASYPLNLSGGPGIRQMSMHLPINFIQLEVADVSGELLSGAAITVRHQTEKITFPAEEIKEGIYESPGIPDGNYVVSAEKEQYQSKTGTIEVRNGEVQHTSYHLNHYVTVKGYVVNGKNEGIAAATVNFGNLKTDISEKVISGTDGVFEAELLVKETGKEAGEISWIGKHGTYKKQFWFDLPSQPAVLTLPQDDTRVPLNFISLGVKSVAVTGIAGATVKFTHRETGKIIEARDFGNGNYEGEELPDGSYDISIVKGEYEPISLENVIVANGEHRSDIQIPKFLHYITLSGTVLSGKDVGVPEAVVSFKDSKRLREWKSVPTREDGSFTLNALVTDIGTETLDVTWNDEYAVTLPIALPSVPEHIQLGDITLPINFIVLQVQNIFGKDLSEVAVSFLKKAEEGKNDEEYMQQENSSALEYSSSLFSGTEISKGTYESPELPDGDYILIAKKEGYIQKNYPTVSVKSGMTVSDMVLNLPHLVTVKGIITDGKDEGVPGVRVTFGGHSSQMSSYQLYTDNSGYFSEKLQITGTGRETITVTTTDPSRSPGEQFQLTHEFTLLTKPGQQEFDELRLPINFIPIRVQDVSDRAIDDAQVILAPVSEEKKQPVRSLTMLQAHNLGDGRYEGYGLKDGTYTVSVSKEGYEEQTRTLTISSGEFAPETVFVLPHYVMIKGIVTDGKGNGVPDTVLEFDTQNITVVNGGNLPSRQPRSSQIKTDAEGYFVSNVLVKKAGMQRVRAVWKNIYVRQFSFQLPEQPDRDYVLEEDIRLPINFAPIRVTNVLSEGIAGATVTLRKTGGIEKDQILFHSLGDGLYEARELLDGVYTLNIHKDGYQDARGDISVQGGEESIQQYFSLPHFVTVQGTIVNGKGIGVPGAHAILTGLSSQLVEPGQRVITEPDGSFQMEVLVTGTGDAKLFEHIEVTWGDTLAIPSAEGGDEQTIPFGISHDFHLPITPGNLNLGMLTLPANFASVSVRDISGKGLSGVNVTFTDENGRIFKAKEFAGGFYEGQNLPSGTYTVKISKGGYKEDYKPGVQIGANSSSNLESGPLTFQLPYYVELEGTIVDGRGQEITSGATIESADLRSTLLPETIIFEQSGNFKTKLLVNTPGKEQLHITYTGENGLHARQVPFLLPEVPGIVNLQRVTLPINFIPIEAKDLRGYGVTEAKVILSHEESGKEITAKELGDGRYEGKNLLNGSYKISIAKEGYKAVENPAVTVAGGEVSEIKSFRLQHYVWISGIATNGEGQGVRDPVIEIERLCSLDTEKQSDIAGKFEVKLEVQKVGYEKMHVTWKNTYRTPLMFRLPGQPTRENLGEVRLPVNFLSILVTDISGSILQNVTVTVENSSGVVQSLKTDQNGFCKTYDLPNGKYKVSVEKSGYRLKSQEVYVSDGKLASMKFMLPHYVVVQGEVKDIMQSLIEGADVLFDEFTDAEGQKLRTSTGSNGEFEQKLLIDNPKFLERQKGHFRIKKGNVEQVFTFKIPTEPHQILHYKTLLFPTKYLRGKIVDADIRTIPIADANISLIFISESAAVTDTQQIPSSDQATESVNPRESLDLKANSLGVFEVGNLQDGEYKIIIEKEGYVTREDFIRISGLLQEQEFTLRKK